MKIILTILSCLLLASAGAQIKIGNIAVSDSIGKKYLLDCYQHPDTMKLKDEWQDVPVLSRSANMVEYMPMTPEQEMQYKQPIRDYNSRIVQNSIGKAFKSIPYNAHADTLWTSIWSDGNGWKHSKDYYQIVQVPAGADREFIGFLVPRKPTEEDFIKWLSKQK